METTIHYRANGYNKKMDETKLQANKQAIDGTY